MLQFFILAFYFIFILHVRTAFTCITELTSRVQHLLLRHIVIVALLLLTNDEVIVLHACLGASISDAQSRHIEEEVGQCCSQRRQSNEETEKCY